jgi:hypothetical protein
MPVGVEHDSDVRLRLVVGTSCAKFLCTTNGRFEIVSGDVEVHHHVLRSGYCGPFRGREGGFVLKRKTRSTRRGLEFHPTGLVVKAVPFQQGLVEVRESLRIGSSDHRRRHLHVRRRVSHAHRMPDRAPARVVQSGSCGVALLVGDLDVAPSPLVVIDLVPNDLEGVRMIDEAGQRGRLSDAISGGLLRRVHPEQLRVGSLVKVIAMPKQIHASLVGHLRILPDAGRQGECRSAVMERLGALPKDVADLTQQATAVLARCAEPGSELPVVIEVADSVAHLVERVVHQSQFIERHRDGR